MRMTRRRLRVMIGPRFEGENMTLANVVEIAILVVIVVVAIRFFVKRG